MSVICPKCHRDITTMKYLTRRYRTYICKCGTDVSRLKLKQLVEALKTLINDS
jgi:lysyl-tRNA synthetase class I